VQQAPFVLEEERTIACTVSSLSLMLMMGPNFYHDTDPPTATSAHICTLTT
jgi:hypothetical protein